MNEISSDIILEDVSFSYRAKKKNACKEAIVGDYEVVDVVLVKKLYTFHTGKCYNLMYNY